MKKILVMLALMLVVPGVEAADVLEYKKQLTRYEVWIEACLYTKYSCIGIAVPKVEYQDMRPGLRGRYRGGDTVYVNADMSVIQTKATLYHEMVHYLQTKAGGLQVPGPAKEICAAEAEAFAETDKRWVRMGMPYRQRGENWWKPYSYCHQYYNPNWEPRPSGWWF